MGFVKTSLTFLVDDNFVTITNIVAVQLFMCKFHLFRPAKISEILIDIVESHFSCRNVGQSLEPGF